MRWEVLSPGGGWFVETPNSFEVSVEVFQMNFFDFHIISISKNLH